MHVKRLLSLLLTALLAVTVLAGCGGGKALSQVIVDLLDGLYANISVEADSDLTAALKKAAAEGGTEEEILSRMIEILNLNGGSITFTRLGSGQQGDHAVTLYFQTGTDPDAAARNALAQWASVLGTLPDDGSYQGDVAMIEAENGYYIALDVEVVKAGKPDKPDTDEDDSTPAPGPTDVGFANDDYSVSGTAEQKTFTVKTVTGLETWADYVRTGNGNTNCTLEASVALTGSWEPVGNDETPYTGTFNGGGNAITNLTVTANTEYQGLFGFIDESGQVLNVTLENANITVTDDSTQHVGIVAGYNAGLVQDCTVSGRVEAPQYVGGIVGTNSSTGTVSGCVSSATVIGGGIRTGGIVGSNDGGTIQSCSFSGSVEGDSQVGGIAGYNSKTITECKVTGSVSATGEKTGGIVGSNAGEIASCVSTGSVTNTGGSSDGMNVGGVAGDNLVGAQITACYHTNGLVRGRTTVGGVAGVNSGQITACYSTSDVSGSIWVVGGAVGSNFGKISACYWKGTVSSGRGGVANQQGSGTADEIGENSVTWESATEAMNDACEGLYSTADPTNPPKLTWEN